MRRNLAIWVVLLFVLGGAASAALLAGGQQFTGRLAAVTAATSRPMAVPPASSPLARKEHPRVFFTRTDLPALRTRLAAGARNDFQAFLNMLASPQLNKNQQAIEATWGAVNYAFVAALDPAELRRLGFALDASIDTSEKLCRKAETYAVSLLPVETKRQAHDAMVQGYPKPLFLPLIVAYDWCYSNMSADARTKIVDGLVAKHNREYAGHDVAHIAFSNQWLANNQNAAKIHDALGILAFYGDSYPAAAVQQEMFDAMSTLWTDRLIFELKQYYGESTGWHEGFGYFGQGFVSLGVGLAMIDSAMGTNVFRTNPFFTQAPVFVSELISPHSELNTCGSKGNEPCSRYVLKYGDSGGLPTFPCRTVELMSGALRDANPANARLGKWLSGQPRCLTDLTGDGGTWANATLYQFIFGAQDVPAQPPDRNVPRATRHGLGMYSFRAADTLVTTTSQPYSMYSHGDKLFGHFTIEKYGFLVINSGNDKGGEARLTTKGSNVFLNTLGIHKGANDPHYDENGTVVDPVFASRGFRALLTSKLLASRLSGDVNYVFDDQADSWDKATADVAQREFLSITGPVNSEYLVVFDRVRVINPSTDEKVWKIWVTAQPRFVNGTVSTPRTGKWTSSNADTIEVTNQLDVVKSSNYSAPPTHGRLYLRTLSGDGRTISALGGPGKEFQSGNDDGSTPWNAPEMTPSMWAYLGWGRIEVRPSTAKPYDTFLNVMQFGDSRTLTAMTPTRRIQSTEGGGVGVHIADPQRESVAMFVDDFSQVFQASRIVYTFSPVAARSTHFVADLAPGDYFVSASSSGNGRTVTVSKSGGGQRITAADGTVLFDLNGTTVIPGAPAAPKDLRLVN
jgi:hypothetical protein